MAGAKTGDTVKVHYTGRLTDGTIFDDSLEREPLEFIIGKNNLIAGFEEAVIGMNAGDWKTVNIPAEQAYGAYMKEMAVEVDIKQLPPGFKPVLGAQLQVTQDEGQQVVVSITKITPTHVTLDANHPLAGKELVFDIKLVEIAPPGKPPCSCCH
jgi:peptidylprolyl isomerase